ncbi:hypothetical protein [Sphingobium algorifonticola]|uniref:Uncharacterized protein n=1 Tax=Sphingobium algorifonticola TaxID=2008318 RepID=A0A437JBU8_9SPHN|nr:hypothetical protein [Sphingobium algorifonticola]RVT43396.1 hypothetical protein ENE74_01830 [Sphingobium algorifonticola]
MSRAINLSAAPAAVTTLCAKHAIRISSIEPLESGGTRVVLLSMDGADSLRKRMKDQVLTGPVTRSGLYMARRPLPFDRH